jgi:hypothetical protein
MREAERKYPDTGRFVREHLPRRAMVLAMQHSGSVRYYSGRLTMRGDVIEPRSIDQALAALRARGLPVYALLEDWEDDDFRRRFAGRQVSGTLTTPIARSEDGVRLYTLEGGAQDHTPVTMPRADGPCIDGSPRFVYPEAERRLAGTSPVNRRFSDGR